MPATMRAMVLDTNDRYSATAGSAPSRATAMTAGSATPGPDAVLDVALGVLGAQVMLIAVVHLLGV